MEAILGKLHTGTTWHDIPQSLIRLHQHASGARHGFEQAIGRSCGRRTTKIHLATDANGLLIDFKITGGEVHEIQVVKRLVIRIFAKNKKLPSLLIRIAFIFIWRKAK
ncbi:transposase [Acinetobacter corruptisaponis]|uniref:transposase n=1 Tax=Acinetobacter TaxID=469 RepID=UPI003D7C25B7